MLSDKRLYHDQLGRKVYIPVNPQRIISTVPSQTELLFELGLHIQLIGLTQFCIHPAVSVASKTVIGGTKKLDTGLIKSLQPDLIIANKEENDRSQIEELMQFSPVWISDVNNLAGALQMINSIGHITGKFAEAKAIADTINTSFETLKPVNNQLSVVYFIWRKPYMVAGKGTFINDMLKRCGLRNCIDETRYPEIDVKKLIEINPNVVLLSSEPYPFKQKHIEEIKAVLPHAKVCMVDGEMFSWYGSRLQYSASYFNEINKILDNQP